MVNCSAATCQPAVPEQAISLGSMTNFTNYNPVSGKCSADCNPPRGAASVGYRMAAGLSLRLPLPACVATLLRPRPLTARTGVCHLPVRAFRPSAPSARAVPTTRPTACPLPRLADQPYCMPENTVHGVLGHCYNASAAHYIENLESSEALASIVRRTPTTTTLHKGTA